MTERVSAGRSEVAPSPSICLDAGTLTDLVTRIFVAAGCSLAESQRVARSLVGANLAGHDSHGVARAPRYVQWLQEAILVADQTIEMRLETPVLAVVDGRFGLGQTVAPQAIRIGIAKAKAVGLSAVALRNSGHLGRIGDWAEMAAAENVISLHFVNVTGNPLVAPFGGVERRFSTAPVCIGIPRPGLVPLILDFATALVAEGKVLVASQGGGPLPDDALIGPDGRTSGDPQLLYGEYRGGEVRNHRRGKGALRAFGEHKGSGLALMCELLGGALTGNGVAAFDRRWSSGMFSFYVDPRQVDPDSFFPAEVARYLAFVKSSRPVAPGAEVLLPGEPEARMCEMRQRSGIPLPADSWAALVATARSLGVMVPSLDALRSTADVARQHID